MHGHENQVAQFPQYLNVKIRYYTKHHGKPIDATVTIDTYRENQSVFTNFDTSTTFVICGNATGKYNAKSAFKRLSGGISRDIERMLNRAISDGVLFDPELEGGSSRIDPNSIYYFEVVEMNIANVHSKFGRWEINNGIIQKVA